jgi:putative membrane protein
MGQPAATKGFDMHNITTLIATASAAAALAAPAAATAQHTPNSVPTWDRHVLLATAEGAHFEIDMGRIARRHGHGEEARRVGALMVKDHSGELHAVQALAAQLHVKLPEHPSVLQRHEISDTAAHTGAGFDRAYARLEVSDHIMDIETADGELAEGGLPQVKALAAKYRLVYQRHLAAFRKLAADVGAS